MSAGRGTVTCPRCGGAGELTREPHDWWHGSGVNVEAWTCNACGGHGDVPWDVAAELQPPSDASGDWDMHALDAGYVEVAHDE